VTLLPLPGIDGNTVLNSVYENQLLSSNMRQLEVVLLMFTVVSSTCFTTCQSWCGSIFDFCVEKSHRLRRKTFRSVQL